MRRRSPVQLDLESEEADLLGQGPGALLEAAHLVALVDADAEQQHAGAEEQQVGRHRDADQVGGRGQRGRGRPR